MIDQYDAHDGQWCDRCGVHHAGRVGVHVCDLPDDDDPTHGTCDYCGEEYELGNAEDHCGECGQCNDHCECEPATCYYTGRGPCGDCRNVNTNQPMNCFGAPR